MNSNTKVRRPNESSIMESLEKRTKMQKLNPLLESLCLFVVNITAIYFYGYCFCSVPNLLYRQVDA